MIFGALVAGVDGAGAACMPAHTASIRGLHASSFPPFPPRPKAATGVLE